MIRLPDPYTDPGIAPGFQVASLTDNRPVFVDNLPSGRQLKTTSTAQQWGIVINYPELLFEEFQLVKTTLDRVESTGDTLGLILPHYELYTVKQDPSTMSIAAEQVGNTLVITNFTDNKVPFVGRFLKLTNSTKVYKIIGVEREVNTLTLTIYPNLAKKTTLTTKPVFNNIIFECSIEEVPSEVFSTDGIFEDFSVALKESIT